MRDLLPKYMGAAPASDEAIDETSRVAASAFATAYEQSPDVLAVCVVVLRPDGAAIPYDQSHYSRQLVSVRAAVKIAGGCDLSVETLAAAAANTLQRNAGGAHG